MTFNPCKIMHGTVVLATISLATLAQAQAPLPLSPQWTEAMPAGPVAGTKMTEEYAGLVARDVCFWAWPLVNVYNRRIASDRVQDFIIAGPGPSAPINRLAMLTDYIAPEERGVARPNQDVVYGAGSIALDRSPVVIQVPDFGDRFWVYQGVDLRTDSFADLGIRRWTGRPRCCARADRPMRTRTIGEFSLAYANQTVRDHAALVAAVKAGRLKALVEEDL